MKLNVRTSETGTTEHVGIRLYTDTVEKLDSICKEKNIKRSVLIRHAINEFLDGLEVE